MHFSLAREKMSQEQGRREDPAMIKTIAISNQKGGVAKTTTCLSLGASLTEMGYLVLLVDLDPQASLTLSMGLRPEDLRRTVEDALLGNTSLVSVSRETSIPGMDILPANQRLLVLDKVLYGGKDFQYRLKRGLETMGQDFYDFVLIDCPSSIGTLTLNALTAADMLIVPIQCEYYAAHALRPYLKLVHTLREQTNPGLAYRVLVTMYDQRNKICRLIFDQMQLGLNRVLLHTIIEVDNKLRESPAYGQPITRYASKTRGAEQYRALAKELLNGVAESWTVKI
jgi:chromosome partitioning protein